MKRASTLHLLVLSVVAINAGCNSKARSGPAAAGTANAASQAPGAVVASPGGHAASAGASSIAGAGGGAIAGSDGTRASGGAAAAAAGTTGGSPAGSAGSSGSDAAGAAQPIGVGKPRRAVSADFLNQTLSIVDVDKLTEGAKREDALIGMVDLSMYTPGPLAVAVTPDGRTAVVSISGGWLTLVTTGIPAGNGTVVFVDLDTLKVKGELFTGASPMGIVITQDGAHAFVGQLSDTYISYVDIEKMTYEPIQTGNQWNEELAIDDTGTTGALTTGTAGDSMTFSVMTPTMNGQTLGLTGDAGGVAFFPGTKFAFVVQAPTMLTGNTGGYNVIDASDPTSPKVTDNQRVTADSRQAYPVTAVANRKSVVYPSADNGKLSLIEMSLDAGVAKMVQTIAVGDAQFSYGLSSSPDGKVLACAGTEHYVAVVDLNTGKAFTVPWGITQTGPLDIKFIP